MQILHPRKSQQKGAILASILAIMIFLSTMLFALVLLANSNLVRARTRVISLQAQYAAETGADSAIAHLNANNAAYSATDTTILTSSQYAAKFSVSIADGANAKEKIITATGKVFSPATATTPKYTRTIKVTAQRSSTTTASSILSRNIIDVDSGVKNITGKDIYLNGYIVMRKNTTNLIAENITVGGKNTGASNCSIGGTGNLVKPTSFSDPTQTKTNLRLAFNNCINPPGNTSNADFNVSANQGTVSTIESTYIPWSQYMDTSYSNAGNCNDWTTGTSPRQIPSTTASKLTHYPDSSPNIASSCGTSGSLALGNNRYDINDHVHIRANLCAAAACAPTFYNPTSSIKYVFIEGTVNFDGIQTAAGSGPLVFIAYGADPASKASACPYGGSIYLGKDGTTSAPAIFLLATNGLCLDKTKFGSDPALGGIAGKNIYVATNSGSPFDLELDKGFPVEQIPIDLTWRATRYQKL